MTTAGEGRVSDELICVIITAGEEMNTVKMTVWGTKMDLCVIITAGEDGICVLITAGKGDEIGSLTNGV